MLLCYENTLWNYDNKAILQQLFFLIQKLLDSILIHLEPHFHLSILQHYTSNSKAHHEKVRNSSDTV